MNEKYDLAKINESDSIIICRDHVKISSFRGYNNIPIVDLPDMVKESERKAKMYADIYKEWELTFKDK